MTTVNIEQFQSDFSNLADRAVEGEEIIITRAGKPSVRMTAVPEAQTSEQPADTSRRFGAMAGQFTIPEDFDHFMQQEIINLFEGNEDQTQAMQGASNEDTAPEMHP